MAQGKTGIVPEVQNNNKSGTPVNKAAVFVVVNNQLVADFRDTNPGVVINRLI